MRQVLAIVAGYFIIKHSLKLLKQGEERKSLLAQSLITGYGLLLFFAFAFSDNGNFSMASSFSIIGTVLGLILLTGGLFWVMIYITFLLITRFINKIKTTIAWLKKIWSLEIYVRITLKM